MLDVVDDLGPEAFATGRGRFGAGIRHGEEGGDGDGEAHRRGADAKNEAFLIHV